jgi:hypothetical protein
MSGPPVKIDGLRERDAVEHEQRPIVIGRILKAVVPDAVADVQHSVGGQRN